MVVRHMYSKKQPMLQTYFRQNQRSWAMCRADGGRDQVIFKERWRQKEARLRRASKLGQAREWRLLPVIGEEIKKTRPESRPISGVEVKALGAYVSAPMVPLASCVLSMSF